MLYNCSPEPHECGKLLSEPGDSPKTVKRLTAEYENVSERFVHQRDRTFQKQYAHLYAARLSTMRPKLERAAKARWGTCMAPFVWAIIRGHMWNIVQFHVCGGGGSPINQSTSLCLLFT